MNFSHFFINRPIFASVISIFIMLVGIVAFQNLPITQYPNIVPPTISVSANYAGASPEVLMNTVAAPLEQEINGVENMIYMQSQCASNGSVRITVTFETGTNIDMAQVLVQNKVSQSLSRLPKEVRDKGVTVAKRSPDMLMTVNLISPKGTRDKLYLTNYAITNMQDRLSRVYGVSEFDVWGAKEYCMRIWIDPDRLASLNMSAKEIISAIEEQNKQVAAGKINQSPHKEDATLELLINMKGRLSTESEFGSIIVKDLPDGRVIRLKDVAKIELASYNYNTDSYINNKSTVGMGAYQLPGSNAVQTVKNIRKELEELKKDFPNDVDYIIGFDTTEYISESINAVYSTIFDAVILVVFVVLLFLQKFRAAVIPLFAIPVSLVGTFAVMYALGYSINNLTLFGLVLAIGIVVDDAIVVVENVERNMADGLDAKAATEKAMTQVQGALIAIVLVLSCVFLPTAFLGGISGQFYRQFAITIAASTIFSGIVSLTLTPALCALFLKEKPNAKKGFLFKLYNNTFGKIFWLFNKVFELCAKFYGRLVAGLIRISIIIFLLYIGLLYLTVHVFETTPKGFIPKQDRGFINIGLDMPNGTAFSTTEEVTKRAGDLVMRIAGIRYAQSNAGQNAATGMVSSSCGRLVVNFRERSYRDAHGYTMAHIMQEARKVLDENISEAKSNILTPSPVPGIGSGSDFKFMLQDRAGLGVMQLNHYATLLVGEIEKLDSVDSVFTSYRVSDPQLFMEVDRERAQKLNVPISEIFAAMQYNFGSAYVNDFNILGRVYRVVAQGQPENRGSINDIYNLKVPSKNGKSVPFGSLVKIRRGIGPDRVERFNLYSSAPIQGNLKKGYSTGYVANQIEELARQILPVGMGIEWTDLVYQERKAGNTALYIFGVCVVFIFLLLSALYESWTIPLSVILIVPLVLLFAVLGIDYRKMDNNIMSQIGFVVLIGLACKNAILIVEFAKQREARGEEIVSAVSNASKNRLRPILMTSFAFILGVVPLAYGTGSGFELRQALGTSVLFGMLGVTICGCLMTPVFYYIIRRIFGKDVILSQKKLAKQNQ